VLVLLAVVGPLSAGCQSAATREPSLVKTELYFGLSRSSGPDVTEREWREFVDTRIAPQFPSGLTIIDAAGQHLSKARALVRERSKLVILVYPPTAEADAAIDAIRRDYVRRFEQEAVLRVTVPVGGR